MSATIFRKVGLCMFARFASLRKRALSKNNIVYEFFVLFDHLLPLFWRYGLENLREYTEFIHPFSYLPLISGHEMVFTCYYIILFISCFYSRRFLQPQFFNHREHSWCSNVPSASENSQNRIRQIHTHGEGDVTYYNQGYFIQGDKDRQCNYNVILRRFHATIIEVENQYILHNMYMCL